jgi:DNA invertase Pin-like site-specific DNA recombinase
MTSAFGYLRVSGQGQVDGDGFPRQREAIQRYADAHGLEIVRWFQEEGVSGKILERPAWRALAAELLADGVEIVLVEKLDRLARDLLVQETIIGDLLRYGKRLVSTMEPDLCSDDPSRKLIRQIFGCIAEYDRAMIVAKLKAARDRKRRETGKCEGRKPFGHRLQERNTVGYIRELRRAGVSLAEIAAQLDDHRRKAPGGKRWNAMTVRRILRRSNMT